jgi:transketolase
VRAAFIRQLLRIAGDDPSVFLITGDLGFGVLDEFAASFPGQFLNAGVAEQNMTALATGLALEGYTVFTYSIGNFPTLRCLEQLRNDAFYHEANVKVVSVGGGFSYGQLGMSHHATEDLGILRALPGVRVCAPGTAYEAERVVDAIAATPGPAYLRLERASARFADSANVPFVFGRARRLAEGDDLTIVAAGGVVAEAMAADAMLRASAINCRVLSFHSLKPLDGQELNAASAETGGIVTVEENSVLGGLGGAVAEHCLESDIRPKLFRRLGIRDEYISVVGDQDYLRAVVGIDARSIAASVRALLGR